MGIKLIELTDQIWELRWKALGDALKSELGIDFTAEIRGVKPETLRENINLVLKGDADVCRITDDLSPEALDVLPMTTQRSNFAGASPFLVREKNQWWPRPLTDESFARSLTENFGQLDIDSSALVAGAKGAAKLIIAAIVKVGYCTVNVTDKIEEKANSLVAEMKKKFFEVNFQVIPFDAITTLPGVYSLVVNTTPLTLENDLLDELYFFNFLKAGGAVVDLTLVPSQTPLILEAKQWGARHLSGDFIAADRDLLMVEIMTGKRLNHKAYLEAFRKNIDTAPFDASPFLQRFRERGS